MQGPGSGRDSVVRSFQSAGINITVLRDVTPLPHNGVVLLKNDVYNNMYNNFINSGIKEYSWQVCKKKDAINRKTRTSQQSIHDRKMSEYGKQLARKTKS